MTENIITARNRCVVLAMLTVIACSFAGKMTEQKSQRETTPLEARMRAEGIGIDSYVLSEYEGGHRRLDLVGKEVRSLDFLKGKVVDRLSLVATGVTNLNALSGMRLEYLNLFRTPVSDLSPLSGMSLRHLHLSGTRVTDLSPLKGMELESLSIDIDTITNGLHVLKDMQDLYRIGGIPKALCLAQVMPKRDAEDGMDELFDHLEEDTMDRLVAKDPKKFLKSYLKTFENVARYDLRELDSEQRWKFVALCNNLGTGFSRLGNEKDARAYLSVALQFAPKNVIVHRNMGLACFQGALNEDLHHREKLLVTALQHYAFVVKREGVRTPLGKEAAGRIMDIKRMLREGSRKISVSPSQ